MINTILHHLQDATFITFGQVGPIELKLTKHTVVLWIAALLTLFPILYVARKYRQKVTAVPEGFLMNTVEAFVVYVRDKMVYPIMGEDLGRRYLPFVLTLFSFLLVCNFLGLVPTIATGWLPGPDLTIYPSATATGNLWVNVALAVLVLFVGIADGIRKHGLFGYFGHFVPHGVPGFVAVIIWPLEVFGTLIKHAVLAIRLLANMLAGHAVLFGILGASVIFINLLGTTPLGFSASLIPVLLALLIYAVEILVAIIQAYVFTLLSVIFLDMQISGH